MKRLAQMRRPELQFRLQCLLRNAADRVTTRVAGSRWDASDLANLLVKDSPATEAIATALREGRRLDAHRRLVERMLAAPRPFPIHPADADARGRRVLSRYPAAATAAASLAQPLLEGRRRLLGFTDLDFGQPPDWHLDPVHGRRSPITFWADVPYLDARLGDHKIIWELNRHQHWLVFGRAWWLTGDRRYRDAALAELADWLTANPPLLGINWASMLELGFRCLSWTWAAHFFADRDDSSYPWLVDLLLALDRQLAHVEHNLSYFFSPNTHLLGEALALFVCGHAFPELAASPRRIALGRAVLLDAIAAQIEPDGGHRERSTHYHRYTLDFYVLALTVARLAGDAAVARFTDAVARLAAAARLLADDRHRLPHIGDDDGGALFPICGRDPDQIDDALSAAAALTGRPDLSPGSPPEEVLWLLDGPSLRSTLESVGAAAPAPRSGSLPGTGYFVMRSPAGEHAIVDAGPHGYLNGGHAHADALALTLSLDGQPLLVDPGTGSYTTDPALRDRFRATAAHNTVVIDGRSQSDMAGPFHWRRVADGRAIRWHAGDAFDYFAGVHAGYAPVGHYRHVLLVHGDLLLVADYIDATDSHCADVHWHLDPAWQITPGPAIVHLRCGARDVQIASTLPDGERFFGDAGAGLGWYSPSYGRIEPLTTLRWRTQLQSPSWICTAVGLDPANRLAAIEQDLVGGAATVGVGWRIHRMHSCDEFVLMAPDVAVPGHRWRTDAVEADAHALFHRRGGDRQRLIVIDAANVDVAGDPGIQLRCRQREPGIDVTRIMDGDTGATAAVELNGAASEVELRVGGRPLAVAAGSRFPLAGVR